GPDRPAHAASPPREAVAAVPAPEAALAAGEWLEQVREQPLHGCVRHPAGASWQQDGQRRRSLADESGDPEPPGAALHQRAVPIPAPRAAAPGGPPLGARNRTGAR